MEGTAEFENDVPTFGDFAAFIEDKDDEDKVEFSFLIGFDGDDDPRGDALIIRFFDEIDEPTTLLFEGFDCTAPEEGEDAECAVGIFVRDVDIEDFDHDHDRFFTDVDEYYLFTDGSIVITDVNDDSISGTFLATGTLHDADDEEDEDADELDISNGQFDVPRTDMR